MDICTSFTIIVCTLIGCVTVCYIVDVVFDRINNNRINDTDKTETNDSKGDPI